MHTSVAHAVSLTRTQEAAARFSVVYDTVLITSTEIQALLEDLLFYRV